MHRTADIPADDQQFLDWVFDQAVQRLEDGLSVTVDELLKGRDDLRGQIEELIRTARQLTHAAPPDDGAPTLTGFTIVREIGRGGMGAVYLARQESLGGRPVALKVLPWSFASSPRSLERFRGEANAIARLRHPHIVSVHDIIHDGQTHAFAMEWVEGSSLGKLIEHAQSASGTAGSASTRQDDARIAAVRAHLNAAPDVLSDVSWPTYIIRIGIAIARALQAVHDSGLLHRDVKPSNILIRRDGAPLLSDFGLVREADATITQPGGFAGTAAYAAPEQLRGDAVDCRADVYALGVTLYHALTLRIPFNGNSAGQVLHQIERGAAPPLRKAGQRLPVDLQTIVAKAMDPDPARRYQTADEFADDLDRLLNLQPIKAKPPGMVMRTIKMARRNRAALVAATLGGVLTIGVMALVLTYFIGFPIWSKTNLQEARLVLLDPEQSDALFSSLFFRQENAGGVPIAPTAVDRALSHYDAAVRFAPFDKHLAQEREVVRLARQITGRPQPSPVSLGDVARFPLTEEFGERVYSDWMDYALPRDNVHFRNDQIQSASTDDLRALGLLALLCGDPEITMDAWTALDLKGSPDAMVDSSFGIVYLVSKQYGRAYPRLRNAVEAFPNVGFLTVYLAEAAVKCGDLEKAQLWLDQAATMPRLDRFNGLKRVQAGLHVAAGNVAEARRNYEDLFAEDRNVVAFDEYAQFLESHGDLEQAMIVYLRVIGHGIVNLELFRHFTDATERWWARLEEPDRRQLIEAIVPWEGFRRDRDGILTMYGKCITDLGDELPPGGIPRIPALRD